MVHSYQPPLSLTSFISQLITKNNNNFPLTQIRQYCQDNKNNNINISLEKIYNMIQGEEIKFNRTYENYKQVVVLYYIALVKYAGVGKSTTNIGNLNNNMQNNNINNMQNNKQTHITSQSLINRTLTFIFNLITSKLYLTCLYAKSYYSSSSSSIYTNIIYFEYLIQLIIPKLLQQNLASLIVQLILKLNNKQNNQTYLFNVGFLAQFMIIIKVYGLLTEDSSKKFKQFMLNSTKGKKCQLLKDFWISQNVKKKELNFSQLFYFRINLQSPKTVNFYVQNNKIVFYPTNSHQLMQNWITNAYDRIPSSIVFNNTNMNMNNNNKNNNFINNNNNNTNFLNNNYNPTPIQIPHLTALEIYKFLFKLQVFSSSPLIQQLDIIIPNQQFLDLFSKFLIGQRIQEQNNNNNQNNQKLNFQKSNIFDKIDQIHRVISQIDTPFKKLIQKQLKIMWESEEMQKSQKKGRRSQKIKNFQNDNMNQCIRDHLQ